MSIKILLVTKNKPEHFGVIDALQETSTLCGTVFQTDDDNELYDDPIISKYRADELDSVHKFFGVKFSHASNIKTLATVREKINSDQTISFINNLSPDLVITFDTEKFTADSLSSIKCDKWNIHKGYIEEYKGHNCHFWANYDMKPYYACCTVHKLIDELNNGDIIHQTGVLLRKEDTVQDTSCRSLRALINSLPTLIEKVKSGKIISKPQKNDGKYYGAKEMTPDKIREMYAKYGNRVARLIMEGRIEQKQPELFRQP